MQGWDVWDGMCEDGMCEGGMCEVGMSMECMRRM